MSKILFLSVSLFLGQPPEYVASCAVVITVTYSQKDPPLFLVLMLCFLHPEIPNHFIFELAFCSRSLMCDWSMCMGRGAPPGSCMDTQAQACGQAGQLAWSLGAGTFLGIQWGQA